MGGGGVWRIANTVSFSSFVFVMFVASKRGFSMKFCVMFCIVRQKSVLFNLLCVLVFFQNAGSHFCFLVVVFLIIFSLKMRQTAAGQVTAATAALLPQRKVGFVIRS